MVRGYWRPLGCDDSSVAYMKWFDSSCKFASWWNLHNDQWSAKEICRLSGSVLRMLFQPWNNLFIPGFRDWNWTLCTLPCTGDWTQLLFLCLSTRQSWASFSVIDLQTAICPLKKKHNVNQLQESKMSPFFAERFKATIVAFISDRRSIEWFGLGGT